MKIKYRIIGEYATKSCFFDIKKLTFVTGNKGNNKITELRTILQTES